MKFRRILQLAPMPALLFGSFCCRGALTIAFDYSYDTAGFFTDSAKAELQAAANEVSCRLTDSLQSITPSGLRSWNAKFNDPSTGNSASVHNLNIPANTIWIYVGARVLPGSTIGSGTAGGFDWSALPGDTTWATTIASRGQLGALGSPATDFGPWGGSISFSSAASWYFGAGSPPLGSSEYDFYSVAVHELGHILGIGTAGSWNGQVSGHQFTGPNAENINAGSVTLTSDNQHWAEHTMSYLPGTSILQEAAMDPTLQAGTRKYFTDLDFAAFSDIGWQVSPVPEPQAYASVAALLLLAYAFNSHRRSR